MTIATNQLITASDMTAALNTKEQVVNRVDAVGSSSTDDQYPSSKAASAVISSIRNVSLKDKALDNAVIHLNSADAASISGAKNFKTSPTIANTATEAGNYNNKLAFEAQLYAINSRVEKTVSKVSNSNWASYSSSDDHYPSCAAVYKAIEDLKSTLRTAGMID
ncbi:hypothetical protein NO2_0253 [Candidatus Termititenax persephonae]|uniref:Uncharacterized protein n=1 Tax=Candidatus Termititenax persephonae TaxID=2218525 RepID=A0A388TFR0_9BACT|nr:hypothetical protein NO2_0253 [Candidatus Termititenax persephonae]